MRGSIVVFESRRPVKCHRTNIRSRLVRLAQRSPCRYKVAAIGIDRRGRVITAATNRSRYFYLGGGKHAEMEVMRRSPRSLVLIIILRLGQGGVIRPITPCLRCTAKAQERGIRIVSINSE